MGGEVADLAVVGHHPAAVLKRMAVEYGLVADRRFAYVGQDRLGGDHPADLLEELVAQGGGGAAGHVGCALDVVGDAPSVRVVRALDAQGVLRVDEGAVDLARDDAAETEEPAHAAAA